MYILRQSQLVLFTLLLMLMIRLMYLDATSKQQQLTVLSGDYFSGIHYRLLASMPEFGFIRSLSETIGQINEMKTIFHDQLPDEPETID